MSPGDWSANWEALVPVAAAAAYLVGTRAERQALRTASFLAGCALLVLGVPPALAARVTGPRIVRFLTRPYVALPLWVGTYALWHVPALYDAALRHPSSLLALEHTTYVVSGALFWWCVWQDVPHKLSSMARTGYVLAAFVLSAPLGLVLALVPRPLYDFYAAAPERVWGLSRLEDQQLGGMTMAGEQSIVFFAVFAYWFTRFLAEQEQVEEVA